MWALLAWMLLAAMLAPATALASPPSNAHRFFYDPDGHLKAAIDPEGSTAEYSWDEAGNLLGISRHASSKLSIVQLSPAKGEVGATVVIEGTGFSTTPASNTVKFNGTAATVSAASAASLTVKVPGGATTGSVTVATPEEGPVTSPGSFTVIESSAPHISSISPTIVAPEEEVTLSGSNFETSAYQDAVTFNGLRPALTSVSTSSIKFKVPPARLGGPVAIATPNGSSIGPDLYVPPTGTAVSKVGTTGRISLGGAKSVAFVGSEKVVLLLVDATAGQRMSLVLSESTVTSGTASIWSPAGAQLASGSFSKSSGGVIETASGLPTTGTYTILLAPSGASAGSVKASAYGFQDITGSITPTATAEGVKQHVAITTPGQVARYSVTMTAGEKVSFKTTNSAFSGKYWIKWLNSKGEQVAGTWWNGAEPPFFFAPTTFSSAGTYTLEVDPEASYTGSVDIQLWEDPDITGQTITPSAEGETKTSTINIPGQRELITFSGTKEHKVAWRSSESSITGTISILRPNGSELSGSSGSFSEFHEVVTLPETGTYSFVVDPASDKTGTVKLTAYLGDDITGSISPEATAEGTKQHVVISIPGQVARYSVTMTAGERVALKTTNSAFSGGYYIKWLNSKGETLFSEHWAATENWFWNPKTFTSAGTYTLLVDPDATVTGSVDLKLWEVPADPTASIAPTAEGESKTFSISIPGQRELVSFSGTSGQTVTMKALESTIAEGTLSILKPDGTQLGSSATFKTSTTARIEASLPTTGTYTVVLDPVQDYTGNVKLTAYLGSHAAWFGAIAPSTELVSFETANPQEPQGYSDIPVKPESTAIAKAPGRPRGAGKDSSAAPPTRRKPGGQRKSAHGSPLEKAKPAELQRAARHKSQPQKSAPTKSARVGKGRGLTRRRHSRHKARFTTPQVRTFHPNAASAWHPPRARRGVHGWEAGESRSPWSTVAQLQASSGTTALAGQALAINGLPLAGVRVSLEDSSVNAETDRSGRFLLAGAPAGHQVLVIDGETAPGKERYGTYETGVDLANHETTTLEYTIWLTPLDAAGDQRVDSPTSRETRLMTPRIPGLEVRIPAGTVIHDAAGNAVKKLNISPIPVDRPPFPLPPFVSVPLYFTVQPGRAYLSKGAQIVYPNWTHLPPGQRVDFWNYDPDDRGWYVYGRGSVTPDGKQVMPDPGVKVWEFTGAMITSSPTPPSIQPAGYYGGDPVDLQSGLFTYHKTDLVLPDSIPIVIQRTYRQADSNSYSFGTGTTSFYDIRLWSTNNYKEADLILPDGKRVHYVRTSSGTGYKEAIYETTNVPGPFFGSTITWDESVPGWNLKLTSGLTYVFGELAPLQAIRDQFGNTLTIAHSEGQKGNITRITSPHGRWVKFTYDGSNRITEITDNGGRHLKYEYTSGLLTKAIDAAGRETKYAYNGSSQMTSVTDARGNKYFETKYDANSRVEKQTDGDGGTFEFAYKLNGEGKVESTTLTEPRANKRKLAFNAEGFLTSETVGLETEGEATTGFERQAATGLLLSTTDPLGRKTALEYDGKGNVKEVTRLAGTGEAETTKLAHEPGTNRVTEATDPLGHTTKYQYGAKGELLKQTDPLGHETTLEYNGDGEPTAITNADNETTKLAYEHGDLSAVTDPLGRESRQFVDALGRVTAITSPGGQQTRFGYNEDNELTSARMPSGAETTIKYDADGDPISITDPRGGETTATYDVMDRIESESDPLKHSVEMTYDKADNLVKAVDRRGNVSEFAYDPIGRLASASFGVSGKTAESTIEYEYDKANRLTNIDDSASGEYVLSYDNLDRLDGLEGPNGSVGYEYDAAGRRERMTATGLGTVAYEYDNASRLTEIASGGQVVSLAYDKANRLESMTLPDGIEQRYGYDKASDPISIAYKEGESTLGEIDYAYDASGRTEATWGSYARLGLPEAMESSKYNAANELTEREGKELEYDQDGNLTSDEANQYSWDTRGQLSGISGASSASFAYDPFGRRISKTLGGITTDLFYDGQNAIQESVEGSVTANLLTGLRPDQLFSRTTESGTDSYLTNALGSTVALANGEGKVETSYTYDPFGQSSEEGEASENPYQFTGRENDGDGLQYNRARYYSPADARFISRDPAGFGGGSPNLYQYVGGNPLDYTDPSGEAGLPVPSPKLIEEGVKNAVSEVGSAIGGVIEGGGHAVDEGGHYATEHPGTSVAIGAAGVCVVASGGACLLGTGLGLGLGTYENAKDSNCASEFWAAEGGTVGATLVGGAPGFLAGGLEAAGAISRGTVGLTAGGRAALNTPPSLASGATSVIVEPGLHSRATSSC